MSGSSAPHGCEEDDLLECLEDLWPSMGEAASTELLELLSDGCQRFPQSVPLRVWMARAIYSAPDESSLRWEDVPRLLMEALQLDPEHPEVLEELGDYYSAIEVDIPRALEWYRKAVRSEDADVTAWSAFARTLAGLGRTEEAFDALSRAEEIYPNSEVLSERREEIAEGIWDP